MTKTMKQAVRNVQEFITIELTHANKYNNDMGKEYIGTEKYKEALMRRSEKSDECYGIGKSFALMTGNEKCEQLMIDLINDCYFAESRDEIIELVENYFNQIGA